MEVRAAAAVNRTHLGYQKYAPEGKSTGNFLKLVSIRKSKILGFHFPSQALKSGVFSVLTIHSFGAAGFKSIFIRLLE